MTWFESRGRGREGLAPRLGGILLLWAIRVDVDFDVEARAEDRSMLSYLVGVVDLGASIDRFLASSDVIEGRAGVDRVAASRCGTTGTGACIGARISGLLVSALSTMSAVLSALSVALSVGAGWVN